MDRQAAHEIGAVFSVQKRVNRDWQCHFFSKLQDACAQLFIAENNGARIRDIQQSPFLRKIRKALPLP
jgi:hypothetical protein